MTLVLMNRIRQGVPSATRLPRIVTSILCILTLSLVRRLQQTATWERLTCLGPRVASGQQPQRT